jgi:hypothetical protein
VPCFALPELPAVDEFFYEVMSIECMFRDDLDSPYPLPAFRAPIKWMDRISTANLTTKKTKYLAVLRRKVIKVYFEFGSGSAWM